MSDFYIWLAGIQSDVVHLLAGGVREASFTAAVFAFCLGALHALTPGHGKAAIAVFFLARPADIARGARLALTAALLHVLSGLAVYLVLRVALGMAPTMFGRPSASFTVIGYGLVAISGATMLLQSVSARRASDAETHSLTLGVGLLPCPLTISVLGFAWSQSDALTVALVLSSLALGVAFTIGTVAAIAIVGRRRLAPALLTHQEELERSGRILQGAAGLLIALIAGVGIASAI